jgi:hypothetical protein
MENWKEYVGFESALQNNEEFKGHFTFFIKSIKKEDNGLDISIDKEFIPSEEYKYTIDEIGDVVESILLQFPKWDKWVDVADRNDRSDDLNYMRIYNKIEEQTRRAPLNTKVNIENLTSVFHKGKLPYDVPLFVSEYQGKYAICKHPDFEKYGFVVELKGE